MPRSKRVSVMFVGEMMKLRQIMLASVLIVFGMPLSHAWPVSEIPSPVGPSREMLNSVPANDSSEEAGGKGGASNKSTNNMKECGRGYVIGVWPNADGWDDWAVWLSSNGQYWNNNGDIRTYRAYSHSTTDYNSGRINYTTILQAMATGAMVAVFDDQVGFRCNVGGSGWAKGPQFNSVQIWYP